MNGASELRTGAVADAIRAHRLVVVLRRVTPYPALRALVVELAAAGARVFEVTMDAPDAAADIGRLRAELPDDHLLGAGTVLTSAQLDAARAAGAAFGVAPITDPELVRHAVATGLPFVPGALSPTEMRSAWEAGATFVKLFPASATGPSFVRELRGPLPEIEVIPTGGVERTTARAWLDAGAVAVGVGGAILRADPDERRALLREVSA